jgi:fumarate hydratase class II
MLWVVVYLCGTQTKAMSEYRIEKDTMGEVKVPTSAYYGAQTQRSIDNFKIAQDINRMPKEIIRAFAYLKRPLPLPTWRPVY